MGKMTIQDCINSSLRLLNQYSITGTEVPLTYNDEADDVARMLDLINDAQMQIATTVRPISESVEIVIPESDAVIYDVITDLEALDSRYNHIISLTFTPSKGSDRRSRDVAEYKLVDNDLYLPSNPAGTYRVEYNRFPTRYESNIIGLTTQQRASLMATQLDNSQDTHEIIPYFVAAMIAVDQNPKAYYAMYNVWETRLARLGQKPAHATREIIEDVYGFGSFSGVW